MKIVPVGLLFGKSQRAYDEQTNQQTRVNTISPCVGKIRVESSVVNTVITLTLYVVTTDMLTTVYSINIARCF